MSDNTTGCVMCGREPEHGYLCATHYARLSTVLRDIEDEAAILETAPSMAQRGGPGGGGTLASHRAPANLDAIVATDPRRGTMRWAYMDSDDLKAFDPQGLDDTASVLETLHSRARTVREDLEYTPPAMVTITSERVLLTDELAWIARQPWVDELLNEMNDLLGQLQRTNKTKPDRPVGRCHLPRFDSICGGTIWQREQDRHLWRVKGDRCVREKVKVADGPAYCERCRAQWDGRELDRLRLIQEQREAEVARPRTEDGRRMLTVPELAAQHSKTENAIRLRLSKVRARAVHGHYDPAVLGDLTGDSQLWDIDPRSGRMPA